MKEIIKKVYSGSEKSFVDIVKTNIQNKNQGVVVTANPEIMMYSDRNPIIKNDLMASDTLITADGIGIVFAYKRLLGKSITRITGVDLVEELIEFSAVYKKRLLIYGSKEEVLLKLESKLKSEGKDFPLKLINGYERTEDDVAEEINRFSPDIVLVCLGVPVQEETIFRLKKRTDGITYVGCGGSIDVISGSVKRAPDFVVKLNLEWAYRIIKQPKRLIRFVNNQIVFIVKLVFYTK